MLPYSLLWHHRMFSLFHQTIAISLNNEVLMRMYSEMALSVAVFDPFSTPPKYEARRLTENDDISLDLR